MTKKHHKSKIGVILISAVLSCIISLVILLSIYGVPDLFDMFVVRSSNLKYCPGFIKKQLTALAWKQSLRQSNSYKNNVHVRNFFLLFPKGRYSVITNANKENWIQCWAIVYGRYYLTMKMKFTKNFFKTGIGSYDDPVFELTELKSITAVGKPGTATSKRKVIYLSHRKGDFEFVLAEKSKQFGIATWNLLVADKVNLKVVDPNVIKNKPLKVDYDFTRTEKSALKGNPRSQRFLANAYYRGYIVTKNYHKAMAWCKKLESNTRIIYPLGWAEFHIGIMFFGGLGVEQDYLTAESWLRKAATKGYSRSFDLLGWMHAEGLGVSKNSIEAEKWYQKGIKTRYLGSFNGLAYFWAEKGTNLAEAKKLIDVVLAKRPNDANSIDTLGWIYYKQGKYNAAEVQLKKSLKLKPHIIVFDHLGDTYVKLGKHDLAVKAWQDGIKLAKRKDEKLKVKMLSKIAHGTSSINDKNNAGAK